MRRRSGQAQVSRRCRDAPAPWAFNSDIEMPYTRRAFLKHVSAASGGLLGTTVVPARWLEAQRPDEVVAPYSLDATELRRLAHHALHAARSAGATFADVRVNVGRGIDLRLLDGKVASTA